MTQPDLARLEVSARDQQIEAICQVRCLQPGLHWSDGMTEGVARIEQMLAERCLDALALPALLARVRELAEALEPFAQQQSSCALGILASDISQAPCDHCDEPRMHCFQVRRARAALTLNRSETDG